jgi:hypothetical protein
MEDCRVISQDGALVDHDQDEANQSTGYTGSGRVFCKSKDDAPKFPQPRDAKTAVIMRPRILVDANSEAITALRG